MGLSATCFSLGRSSTIGLRMKAIAKFFVQLAFAWSLGLALAMLLLYAASSALG